MSFLVFFSMSEGLSKSITAPKGTLAAIIAHVEKVESTLGIVRTRNGDGPEHQEYWDHWKMDFAGIDDKALCKTVGHHNRWVQRLYDDIERWAKEPPEGGETITPEDAAKFWPGLVELSVPPERWTREFYVARMEHLYEVMRGRENEGVTLDTKALTPQQAAAVIRIFDRYLPNYDMRLDVPHGHDYLASSYDGGYDWCGKCGRPMRYEDAQGCRRRGCELRDDAP